MSLSWFDSAFTPFSEDVKASATVGTEHLNCAGYDNFTGYDNNTRTCVGFRVLARLLRRFRRCRRSPGRPAWLPAVHLTTRLALLQIAAMIAGVMAFLVSLAGVVSATR